MDVQKVDVGFISKLSDAFIYGASLSHIGEIVFSCPRYNGKVKETPDGNLSYTVNLINSSSMDILYEIQFPLKVIDVEILLNGNVVVNEQNIRKIIFDRVYIPDGSFKFDLTYKLDPKQFPKDKVNLDSSLYEIGQYVGFPVIKSGLLLDQKAKEVKEKVTYHQVFEQLRAYKVVQ